MAERTATWLGFEDFHDPQPTSISLKRAAFYATKQLVQAGHLTAGDHQGFLFNAYDEIDERLGERPPVEARGILAAVIQLDDVQRF